jgi:hypothetical protein
MTDKGGVMNPTGPVAALNRGGGGFPGFGGRPTGEEVEADEDEA